MSLESLAYTLLLYSFELEGMNTGPGEMRLRPDTCADRYSAQEGRAGKGYGAGIKGRRNANRILERNQESQNSHLTLARQSTTIGLWIIWVQHLRLCLIQPAGQ
jgi:hypothetical protein